MSGTRSDQTPVTETQLAKDLRLAMGKFEESLAFAAPEAYGVHIRRLRETLASIAGEYSESVHWGVAYGGEDGADPAGVEVYDDEADAREHLQWCVPECYVVSRVMLAGPWEKAPEADHDERCCMNGVAPGKGPHPDCPGVDAVLARQLP